jgi:pyruvate kinase
MEKIGRYVEGSYPRRRVDHYQSGQHEIAEELGEAVVTIEEHLGIATILVVTQAGYTSRMVAKFRPRARIVSITPHLRVLRQLKLLWGVECLLMDPVENTDQMLKEAVERVTEEKIVKPEERIIVVSGSVLSPGKTNILGVFTVRDILQSRVPT